MSPAPRGRGPTSTWRSKQLRPGGEGCPREDGVVVVDAGELFYALRDGDKQHDPADAVPRPARDDEAAQRCQTERGDDGRSVDLADLSDPDGSHQGDRDHQLSSGSQCQADQCAQTVRCYFDAIDPFSASV